MASSSAVGSPRATMQSPLQPNQSPLPAQDLIDQNVDLAISLCLHFWPALTVAVNEQWGGPDSAAKRDWLAGAVSELFASRSDTDEEDVEDMLMQVLGDEFECQLEDDSEVAVAAEICRLRRCTMAGRFGEVEALYKRWTEREKKGGGTSIVNVVDGMGNQSKDDDDDDDDDSDQDDENGGVDIDDDVEMTDAPALVPARTKPAPEIDDDGFTKVVGKKRK